MKDKDIIKFVEAFRNGILGDNKSSWAWCFAISSPLQLLLSIHGVESELKEIDVGEYNHIFLRLKDGRVLDPTADQFNWCGYKKLPPVYLGKPVKIHGA